MKQIAIFIKKLLIKMGFESKEIFYINGSDTLPPPLTKEEEERAFSLLSENDATAKEQLIVHNLRLVVYIAKKFESTGVGLEDLVSIGSIGLIKAVNTFCPNKSISISGQHGADLAAWRFHMLRNLLSTIKTMTR